jgi:UDP-glucose 4-epimerase
MKALITGGAGFIGSSMANRLLLGKHNSITVFDNFCSGKADYLPSAESERLKVVIGDLLDLQAVCTAAAGHDIVYHFAANPDIAKGAIDTSLDVQQSMVATYNVLEAMRLNDIKTIVFTSGSSIYGDTGGQAVDETHTPLRPISIYGAGKLAAEALIGAFSHMFGIKGYIFRLANVVGQQQTHGVIFDFINKLKTNPHQLTIMGDGNQSKSFIHIDDVLDAMFFVIAMKSDALNIFNVSTDDGVDVNWIARTIINKMNLPNVDIAYTGGSRGWAGDIPLVRLNTKQIQALGWKPKYSAGEAVELAIDQILQLP